MLLKIQAIYIIILFKEDKKDNVVQIFMCSSHCSIRWRFLAQPAMRIWNMVDPLPFRKKKKGGKEKEYG